MRQFVAFEVSDAAKDEVLAAVEGLRERFPRARWVPRENLHVTVKFLGEVWPRLERWVPDRIEEAVAGLGPFSVRLSALGAFRSPGSARVIWAGLLDDPGGAMLSTARAVSDALATEFPAEKREYSAHLTLARSDPPLSLSEEDLAASVRPLSWSVEGIILFRSRLQRPAPRYEPLRTFPLGLRRAGVTG